MDRHPKLSIVLATKNRACYLDRFFRNMEQQMLGCGCPAELIVIDGASTDGAIEIIRRYEHLISFWVSEPDTGVSEAVNKGLARARGEIIKLVGDEDLFYEGAFKKGVAYLDEHPQCDCVIFHSNWLFEIENGKHYQFKLTEPSGQITFETLLQLIFIKLPQPEAAFFRSKPLRQISGYDEKLHLYAYWDLWLRQLKAGHRLFAVPEIIMD